MLDTFNILRQKLLLMLSMNIITSMWIVPESTFYTWRKLFGSSSGPPLIHEEQACSPHPRYLVHLQNVQSLKTSAKYSWFYLILPLLATIVFNMSHYKAHMNTAEHVHKWVVRNLKIKNNKQIPWPSDLLPEKKKQNQNPNLCSSVTSIVHIVIKYFFSS